MALKYSTRSSKVNKFNCAIKAICASSSLQGRSHQSGWSGFNPTTFWGSEKFLDCYICISLVPRPRGEKKSGLVSTVCARETIPRKTWESAYVWNGPYNRYVYVRFISVSSVMAASLLILLACRMVFRQIDAQKVSRSSTLGSCLPLKSLEGQVCDRESSSSQHCQERGASDFLR